MQKSNKRNKQTYQAKKKLCSRVCYLVGERTQPSLGSKSGFNHKAIKSQREKKPIDDDKSVLHLLDNLSRLLCNFVNHLQIDMGLPEPLSRYCNDFQFSQCWSFQSESVNIA